MAMQKKWTCAHENRCVDDTEAGDLLHCEVWIGHPVGGFLGCHPGGANWVVDRNEVFCNIVQNLRIGLNADEGI